MKFSATFVSSYATLATLPAEVRPEIAVIGRSNVGKSSLINALTDRKQLAKTSSTPGKTQLLNYFLVNGDFFLVDMPGYGYAKESRSKRVEWARIAEQYFLERAELAATGILIDARHPLLESDRMVLAWFNENNLPFFIVLTKTDKTNQTDLSDHIKLLGEELSSTTRIFRVSSTKGKGLQELRKFICELASARNQRAG
jgi:GTP-binding protein